MPARPRALRRCDGPDRMANIGGAPADATCGCGLRLKPKPPLPASGLKGELSSMLAMRSSASSSLMTSWMEPRSRDLAVSATHTVVSDMSTWRSNPIIHERTVLVHRGGR